ncbi:MAG TPA: SRPBCC domain-containing protein [Ohtaekwangia sp.]|uniref:SRPBCC family protein n=1 Tax=Ohtaekwangia sp. TaxID=2066019 RepID=UPI002F94D689
METKTQNLHISFIVNTSMQEAFACINHVSLWWTENFEGGSQKLDDEFTVRFGDVHVSTQKLIEFIPDKKVVWLVTDSRLNFIRDKKEWTNTRISFELSEIGNKTKVDFTHVGLVPNIECYDACSGAWSQYIQESLYSLMATGKGKPTPREVGGQVKVKD